MYRSHRVGTYGKSSNYRRGKLARSARVSSKFVLTTPSCGDLELSMYLVAQLVTMFTLLGQRLSTLVPPIFLSTYHLCVFRRIQCRGSCSPAATHDRSRRRQSSGAIIIESTPMRASYTSDGCGVVPSWSSTTSCGPRGSVHRRVVLLPGNEAGGWPSGGGGKNRAVGNREPPGNGATRVCTGLQRPQATFRLTKGGRNAYCTGCIPAFCSSWGVLFASLNRRQTLLARCCQDCVSGTSLRLA